MLHGPKNTQCRAAQLRRQLTLPETLLWRELRRRREGLKFRRQHPAGRYVLDFFCASARLAVEVDGIAHDMGDRPRRDAERDAWIRAQGVRVLRIAAKDILADLRGAVAQIIAIARDPSTACGGPPPLAGEDLR